jgi:DNA mismatch repair protein MutL
VGRIARLPEDLINKIAAGEVVERPASVVKELVENALDAGARRVSVTVSGGGKSLIRVEDDGHGMSAEDARMALERHATSKLTRLSELDSIATCGFRGEALPSIASVSHLVLRTREASASAGTEIEVRHGAGLTVREIGHPVGTSVEVRDLFGEVPARRKFLRAESTEGGHLAETVTLQALARPDVGFSLVSAKRRQLDAPAVDGLRSRVYQALGPSTLERLIPVEHQQGLVRVHGFVSRPDRQSAVRGTQRLFVNRRPVRDRGISRAIAEAYRSAGAGALRVESILFIETPLDLVDVNVHPAKSEVRFADPRSAWSAVERAIREALTSGSRIAPRADLGRVEEPASLYLVMPASNTPGPPGPIGAEPWEVGVSSQPPPESEPGGPGLVVLGQHRNTYVVATDGEDLFLVDQHTAHERVRFEGLVRGLERQAVESQLLLSPLVVHLPPALLAVVERQHDDLQALGFDIDDFGGGALRLRAVPAGLGGRDPAAAIKDLLSDHLERGSGEWVIEGGRERLAATLACHSAVRAGQALSRESMAAILRELDRCDHPTLCPHGRPTRVRIPREDVARWFGRTGWRRQ